MTRPLMVFVCGLVLATATTVHAMEGTRPRNLVVRSDGTVLATSMGSTRVTQMTWTGSTFAQPVHIEVGGVSWGVCLLDDANAVVSLPLEGELVLLVWDGSRWTFAKSVAVPYYCTEVIKSPSASLSVFVANRGRPPAGAGAREWQHSVLDVNMASERIDRTLVTDREPRALALSPDETMLFVAHAQGALGGAGFNAVDGRPLADHALSNPIYDGGSVIAFDIDAGAARPVHRFAVGSPVRGLAVLKLDAGYRVFFSHVGFGAAGEDVQFGGRSIANTITGIGFDADNIPLERQDFALGHTPDSEARRAVLPEKLAIRVQGERRELWVANGGSGTVSRVRLGADGRIDSGGQVMLTFPRLIPGVARPAGGWLLDEHMTASVAEFYAVAMDTVRGDSVSHFLTADIASNPRAVVYDGFDGRDRILAVTHLAHRLVAIAAGRLLSVDTFSLQPNGAPNPVGPHERNFFTFGRGFDFRELGVMPGSELKVNNLTCGTCHVDAHIDGKLRFTVRAPRNVPPNLPSGSMVNLANVGKPVHVSTVFDMGATEWMFFEGLKTIRDGIDPRTPHTTGPPDVFCGYCTAQIAGFFFDTDEFTRDLQSPMSPYAPQGVLTGEQNEGRLLFEAMNCSRCHVGATRQTFPRTQEAAENLPQNDPAFLSNGQFGPAPGVLETENRLLHDPTQVFFDNDLRVCPPPSRSDQFMNMTDVGTRNPGDGQVHGVNTPALADAWDNRPFMHDGRYRTLVDVLQHTHLDVDDGYRAAPLVYEGMADNANSGVVPSELCELELKGALFSFGTHAAAPPAGNTVTVFDYLTSIGMVDAFVEFLGAISAQTDLCAGTSNLPAALAQPVASGAGSRFEWVTIVPCECRVRWGLAADGEPSDEIITARGTEHNVVIATEPGATYRVVVSANTRGLCFEQPSIETEWTTGVPDGAAANTLWQNEPNPFNPTTKIRYALEAKTNVTLIVYDVNGRPVRTLVNESKPAGEHDVEWDGFDDGGIQVSTGVYFYRMRTAAFDRTRKMLLLK